MDPVVAVSVAGLVATTASSLAGLYFTQRARTDQYREALYAEQLRLCMDLLTQVAESHTEAGVVLDTDASSRAKAWERFRQSLLVLSSTIAKAGAIIPAEVFNALGQYHGAATSFLAKGASSTQADLEQMEQRSGELFNVLRHSMGVDSLSKESLSLFPRLKT